MFANCPKRIIYLLARMCPRVFANPIENIGHGQVPLIGTIKDETYFARYHDAAEYGVLACDCYDVEMLVPTLTKER
jgi:hypothetical protein